MVALWVGEVVYCHIGVREVLLSGDPFQGAALGMVFGAKDLMVPVAQVGI